MPYSTIKLANDGRIATITFNRPDKRNALSVQMIEEIMAALAEV
jgi:enoyl-CoA hydratase/carnithine racemase